jgi:hypothetical protein
MADLSGNETPTDPKAEKSGPVKPPVLEGSARPIKPEEKPAAKAEQNGSPKPAAPPPAPKPAIKRDENETGGSPWLAGLVGGALGLGAAYGLAWFGLWPSVAPAEAEADPRIAQFASTIPELQTVTGTVQDELSTLNGRVAALEEAPAPQGTDVSVSAELGALSDRVDALAAAPAPAVDTSEIDALRGELASLSEALQASQDEIAALRETAASAEPGDPARLPLIFSSLESAFDSGRPFETELAALETAQPDVAIDQAIAGRAGEGLPRPEDVARRLDAVLPDMLAGRPVAANASWQDATADWFRGVVAMRPAGDAEGDSPEAVIARLEAAVQRRDFVAAEAEYNALPATMQAAAGSLGEDISALAAASTLLIDMRSAALGTGAGT